MLDVRVSVCLAYVLVSLLYIHVQTEYHCRIVLTICTLNKAVCCNKTCLDSYAFHLLQWQQAIKTMFELLRVFLVEAVYSIQKRKTHQLAKHDITLPKQLILMQEKINGVGKVSLSVYWLFWADFIGIVNLHGYNPTSRLCFLYITFISQRLALTGKLLAENKDKSYPGRVVTLLTVNPRGWTEHVLTLNGFPRRTSDLLKRKHLHLARR